MIILAQDYGEFMKELRSAEQEFNEAQQLRRKSLQHYKTAGRALYNIREMLEDATPNKPAITDLGTFTSFLNFLHVKEINNKTAYTYIFLYENWDIAERVNLLDSKSCYRLGISVQIIRWAKSKIEQDPNWEGTAEDFFKERDAQTSNKKESIGQQLEYYKSRVTFLEEENKRIRLELEEEVSALVEERDKLILRLEEYKEREILYHT